MSHISLHQEIIELKNHILRARTALQELMHQYHNMNEVEKQALHAEYDKHFKQLEIEIQQKALQNSELQRRAELLMTKYQRGEKLTPELIALIHKVVDKEFDALKSRMRELLGDLSKPLRAKEPAHLHASLPKLYKELAKKLHPDSGADPEMTQKYWISVQKAYDDKDMHTLHALHTLLCSASLPDTIEMSGTGIEELKRDLAHLQDLIGKEQKKIEALKTQIPFCYALGLRDDDWISKHGSTLKQQIEKYTAEIRKSQDIIRMLTGNEWNIDQDTLEKTDPSIKEKREYTEEFIDATYFSGRH
jgi:predicted RNase H-like nuclease (RuvC/YqgF family)